MTSPAPRMDDKQFKAVAATCRWSARSLAVVRLILVDGVSLSDSAAKHQITVKHARVLVGRFQDKAEKMRLEAFMQKEPPRLTVSGLTPYSSDLQTLRDKGYTINQLVTYLRENGVSTSATTVRNFLRSNRA